MTFDQFLSKYSGKTICYPSGSYCGECLSLCKQYIKECFGINPPPSGSNSAYGYWANFPNPLGNVFTKVANTPTGVPRKGDIVIWNTSVGNGYGHIAIFSSGNENAFTSFDANWGGKVAHLQNHTYQNVVGWLTPKEPTAQQEEFMTLPLVRLPDGRVFMVAWDNAMSHIPNPDELNKYWKVQNIREIKNPEEIGGWIVENPNPIKTALAAAQRQIEGIKGELATCKGDFNECTNTMSKMLTPQECDVELAKANQSHQDELVRVYEGHTREINKLNDTVDNLNAQIKKLKEAAKSKDVDKWWQKAIGWLINVIFKRWFR